MEDPNWRHEDPFTTARKCRSSCGVSVVVPHAAFSVPIAVVPKQLWALSTCSEAREVVERLAQEEFSPVLWVHVEKFLRMEVVVDSFTSVVEEFVMAFQLVFTVLESAVNSDFDFSTTACFGIGLDVFLGRSLSSFRSMGTPSIRQDLSVQLS